MSDVDIKYLGNTIASMNDSGSKMLLTQGKYCDGNITVDYTKPEAVWTWMGKNPVLISSFPVFTVALKNTDFNTWTPSTTAAVILASADWGTFQADMANYDYIIKWIFETDLSYLQGATLKKIPKKQASIICQSVNKRSSNYANFIAGNLNQNYYYTPFVQAPNIIYYNANGALAQAYQPSYGFYQSLVAPSFSNGTADSITVTLKRPNLYTRCSDTYMSTERAAEIDKESTLSIKCEVYRVDKPATVETLYRELVDLF